MASKGAVPVKLDDTRTLPIDELDRVLLADALKALGAPPRRFPHGFCLINRPKTRN